MGMTWKALALAGACGLAVCGAARADEIYTFTGNPAQTNSFFAPKVQFEVTDAALAAGSFSVASTGFLPTGDTSEFIGAIFVYFGSLPSAYYFSPTVAPDPFSINVNFGTSGALTGGSFSTNDGMAGDSLQVSANGSYSLVYDGSTPSEMGCRLTACTGTGTWTAMSTDSSAVPEPASFALLGAGLLGLGAIGRRHATLSGGMT